MESLIGSMGGCLKEGKLPSVPASRRLEQCLFPARLHPRCAALQEELMGEWAKTYGSAWAKDLERMGTVNDSAGLAAYFWPNSTDDKRTTTLLKCMHWIFLVDDAVDDLNGLQAEQFCNRLIQQTFSGGGGGGGDDDDVYPAAPAAAQLSGLLHEKEPLIIAVGLEIWNEMQGSSTSSTQRARFAASFTNHLLGQAREKLLKAAKYTEGLLEEYIQIRRASSGFPLCVSMIEYDVGTELDRGTLNNPLLQELHDAVCDHGCWINDILSFPKEYADGDVLLNLLPLLHMRNNQGNQVKPFDTALSQAWQMTLTREEDCARLAHQLLHDRPYSSAKQQPAAGLEMYVETVCGVASGNWTWTLQSPRYKRSLLMSSCTASLNTRATTSTSSSSRVLCSGTTTTTSSTRRAPRLMPRTRLVRPPPLIPLLLHLHHLPIIKANKAIIIKGRMTLMSTPAARVPGCSLISTILPCPI